MANDRGKLVTFTNSSPAAVSLDSAVDDTFFCAVMNEGAGLVTLTPTSGNIDGASSLVFGQYEGCWLFFDGTNWKSERGLGPGGVNAQTGTSYTVAASDRAKLVTQSNGSASAYTLPTTLGKRFMCVVQNLGVGTCTLTPSSGTVNGAANLALATGSGALLFFDGTNWQAMTGGGGAQSYRVGITIDGLGATIPTGVKGSIQVDFAGTIIGWSIEADQSGSITVEIDKHASSAPPSAPAIPNTTTDKISASAPVSLSSAQSAAVAAAGVSTWTTAVAQWDSIQFNVTAATTVQRVTLYLRIQGS